MYGSVSVSSPRPQTERRRTLRVEVLGQLHGSIVALRMEVLVRDVGEGGFAIEAPIPFPKQSTHDFRFTAGPDGADVVLRGECAHCLRISARGAAPSFLTGFTFVADDDASRRVIDAFVASLIPAS